MKAVFMASAGRKRHPERLAVLLMTTTLGMGTSVPMAFAQATQPASQTQAHMSVSFSIPPQSLPDGLTQFGRQSGWQVAAPSGLLAGERTQGANGVMPPLQALQVLLTGTGLTYTVSNGNTVTLVKAVNGGNTGMTLPAIQVRGAQQNAQSPYGPGVGYIATRSETATKSDTPIIATPQTVNVVTKDEMKQQGVRTVSDALRYTPGVQDEVYGYGTRADWTLIRGFDASNALFLDGLRTDQTNFVYELEPYGLERIEVLKGPASVLYGANVPGGLINGVSKRPTDTTQHEIQISGGSNGDKQLNFDTSGPVTGTDGKLEYRLVGAFRNSNTQVNYTNDNRQYIAPSLTWKIDPDDTVTVLAEYLRERSNGNATPYLPAQGSFLPNPDGEISTSTFLGDPGFDHENYDQASVGLEYTHRFNDSLKFISNSRYSYLMGDEQMSYGTCLGGFGCDDGNDDPSSLERSAFKTHTVDHTFQTDNRLQYTFYTGAIHHEVSVGADFRHLVSNEKDYEGDDTPIDIFNPIYHGYDTSNLSIDADNDETLNQFGIYAQDQLAWRRWRLLLGIRHDWVSDNNYDSAGQTGSDQETQATTGRAGLVYLFPNGVAPYVSYSTSFLPTSGVNAEGVPYKPTKGQQEEVGVKYQPPGYNVFLTASLFNLKETNVESTDPNNPLDYLQTGEERNQGLELEAKAMILPGWDIDASYAYSNSEILKGDDAGSMMPLVPRHYVSVWSHYQMQKGLLKGLSFGAGYRYRSSVYYAYRTPPISLVDLAASYDLSNLDQKLKGLTLQVNAANVGDVKYVAACLDDMDCYWGQRRTVYATLTYDW